MLRTLRRRFILSHILPLLIMIPLLGIALIYVVETQVLLPNYTSELQRQALLASDMAVLQDSIWADPQRAQQYISQITSRVNANVALISPDGRVLAASDSALGSDVPAADLQGALEGDWNIADNSAPIRVERADILIPVRNSAGQPLGFVRLTRERDGVLGEFVRLRYYITAILVIGLFIGTAVGWALALHLERPLRRITHALHALDTPDGEHLSLRSVPDEISAIVAAYNDQSERLKTLEETRRRLLANLVHELGRPLGALNAATDALLNGAGDDREVQHELTLGMSQAIGRLRRLLDDLAQMHNQIAGTLELQLRTVNLTEWLRNATLPWHAAAEEKGLYWDVHVPADLPQVKIDPDRLAQALGNLLSNAIRYTPTGGNVEVRAGIHGDTVWISVNDSGPGIAIDEQANLFAPFYMARTHRRFPQGMGLGLTIANDLAAAHGGAIRVESAVGQGSRFTLEFPCRSSDSLTTL